MITLSGDCHVAKEGSIELDVGPTQVELGQPCDLVERRYHQHTHILLFDLLTHARELRRGVYSSVFDIEGDNRILLAWRSPGQIDKILAVSKTNPGLEHVR